MHHISHIIFLIYYFNALTSGIPIAISIHKETNSVKQEAAMKKFATMLEDLWVAVTFAEAGIFEAVAISEPQPRVNDAVHAHSA